MLISVVVPFYDEEPVARTFCETLIATWDGGDQEPDLEWELICVNDGSRDRTLEILVSMQQHDPRIKVVDLSRNFNQQIAISAGLDFARGDAVIIMDADLQDPPEVLRDLIAKWQEGYHVVYAARRSREGESFFKKATSSLFYRLMRSLMRVDLPLDTGDFRLLDRQVVDVLCGMGERHRFMRGLSSWVGFRQTGVRFDRAERYAGETKYPLRSMLRIMLDAVTGFSYQPLYMASYLGFLLALLALAGIVAVIVLRVSGINALGGQATTLVSVLLLGGVQLIFLGIIGAYLGRIYDEVKGRPLYIVRRTWGVDGPAHGSAARLVLNDEVRAPGGGVPEE